MKRSLSILAAFMLLAHASIATAPVQVVPPGAVEVPRSRRLARFFAWIRLNAAVQSIGRVHVPKLAMRVGVVVGLAMALHEMHLPALLAVGAFGVNDAAITVNDLLTKFIPTIVPRVDEQDAFAPFFTSQPKAAGMGRTINIPVGNGSDEAIQQAPGAKRISRQRQGYEVQIVIPDKWRDSRQITWEKIDEGRLNEVQIAVEDNITAMARARNRFLGSFIQTNAAQNSGTPTDPAATGTTGIETSHWWNSNDTQAPPSCGENTFAAGHDHVETGGAAAITADRLRDVGIGLVAEHGYGANGLVVMVNLQEERTILKFATVVQQNQTLAQEMRDRFQRAGNISALNGFLGLTFIRSNWISPGVIPVFDANLAGLPGGGGAQRIVERELRSTSEEIKDSQSTWIESDEMYGAGIAHKGAGTVLHVA